MGRGRLRLLKVAPGPRNLAAVVREFCARGGGTLTALSDVQLRTLKSFVPEGDHVDLKPFGTVVSNWAVLSGEEPRPLAQTGHLTAAIGEACARLPVDSPFYKSRDFAGFHEMAAATIKELAAWGFDPLSLEALAEECSPNLAGKLRSIAYLQTEAEQVLETLGREMSHTHFQRCIENDLGDEIDLPSCLIVAGTEVTPKQIEWIDWAHRTGAEVTVAVVAHSALPHMFPALEKYEEGLGIEAEPRGEVTPFLNSLFTGGISEPPGIDVSAFYAADPLAEVEWALRGCLEAAMEGEWDDLGIYARNLEEYAPLIESAAMRLGVPIRLARRAPLLTNSCVRTLLAAMRFAASDDVREIERLARSSYVGLTQTQRKEIVDAAAGAHADKETQWSTFQAWGEEQMLVYPWLSALLEWRSRSLGTVANIAVWIEHLKDLKAELTWLPAEGHSMDRDHRALGSLERALAQKASIENAVHHTQQNLKEFTIFAANVASDTDTSIPVAENGVQVANSAEAFGVTRRLYVLGMLEGVFPRRRAEDPVLTDDDRREISEKRKLTFDLPDSFAQARAERDEFLSVCAVPHEALVFSYPETTDDRDNIPAFYLEEVRRAVGGSLAFPRRPRQELAPAIEECLAPRDKEVRAALDGPKAPPPDLKFAREETRQTLKPAEDAALEPAELRKAIECPFRHFVTDLLQVYPDRERRWWQQLRRLPQKGQLAAQPDEPAARNALTIALENELDQIKAKVDEWEINLLRRGGERMIEEWIDREFTARNLWPKDPGSEKPNVQFGDEGLRDELPRVGKIKGSVAGTSKMGPYKVVHLVESNTPSPDRNSVVRLKDRDALYYGLHLLAEFDRDSAMAVEVESLSGGRKLLVLPRVPEPALAGDVERGLEVLDLGSEADPAIVRKIFFDKVKDLLEQAAKAIREVDVRALKGEHCQWCDYGELCRNSSLFGEEESPFEDENGD